MRWVWYTCAGMLLSVAAVALIIWGNILYHQVVCDFGKTPTIMYRRPAFEPDGGRRLPGDFLAVYQNTPTCHDAYSIVLREEYAQGVDTTKFLYGCACISNSTVPAKVRQ